MPIQHQLPLTDVALNEALVYEQSAEERGAVFTRREVVEFILDLIGYTIDQPLETYRLLEPAVGQGDFLLPALERLLTAASSRFPNPAAAAQALKGAIYAVDIHADSLEATRHQAAILLERFGFAEQERTTLLDTWLVQGDFLLIDLPGSFTHIIGNPPYVRQERIPDRLLKLYRARYTTLYDRADLYVPFLERSLRSLADGGLLGVICADRWMKNRYGGPLRALITEGYHLVYAIDMVDTDAFHSSVVAYPAITVIKRGPAGATRTAARPTLDAATLNSLAQALAAPVASSEAGIHEVPLLQDGEAPWILHSTDERSLVRRLEERYVTLTDEGCTIGIGVATGADRIFIAPYNTLDVEPDRKLPLVMTKDIQSGTLQWRGLGVINPFMADGQLVALHDYPRLAAYLVQHEAAIRQRHCARKNPTGWYRTIDRIYPELAKRQKLLIPDIKGTAHIVYEDGQLYPHHNLYYLTSETWDLGVLQMLLQSGIAMLFVSAYSTTMRGGYLRFQSQYLRRIRVPAWEEIPPAMRDQLQHLAISGDRDSATALIYDLYELNDQERRLLNFVAYSF